MGTLQRLFWRSTFNPLIVFGAILLAFFAFRANSTERAILIALALALLAAESWRAVARARRTNDATGAAPADSPTTDPETLP